jgi:dUTP pyrophosphatase
VPVIPLLAPLFYTLPGDDKFAPKVSHPGEDAGADIRLYRPKGCASGVYEAIDFLADLLISTTDLVPSLFVNGERILPEQAYAKIDQSHGAIVVAPGQTILAETGFKVKLLKANELPEQFAGFVCQFKIVPRSGLAHKHGIVVTNSPGIIDAGYRDWVKVSLTNRGNDYHIFTHGARIAQGICELAVDLSNSAITNNALYLDDTARGTSGFGGTGIQ